MDTMGKLIVIAGPRQSGKSATTLEVVRDRFGAGSVIFGQSVDIPAGSGSHFEKADIQAAGFTSPNLVSKHSIADIFNTAVQGGRPVCDAVVLNNLDTFKVGKTALAIRQLLKAGIHVVACAVDLDENGNHPQNTMEALAMASEVIKTAPGCAHIPEASKRALQTA